LALEKFLRLWKNIHISPVTSYNLKAMSQSEVDTAITSTQHPASMQEDITALKKLNAALEERVKRLENYVRQLAHDLKTPLTPLVGASDLLASGFNQKPWVDLAQSIKLSADNLHRMVDELLDLEQCDGGRLRPSLSSIDPVKVVTEAVTKAEAGAPVSRANIVTILPSSPQRVRADEMRLRQVIGILLANALKFTPNSGKVIMSVIPSDGAIRFAVADSGTGIAEEDLPYIFEPYQPTDRHRPRAASNGLALAKKLVELHDGHVGVDSAPGRGTTFWFDLPIDKSTAETGAT
jgi:signal transduction histidine kinase